MAETLKQDLSGVSETLLLTVYHRAMETQRQDALIQDEKAVELVFDSHSPFFVWTGNVRVSSTKFSARLRWGIWRGQEIEGWGDGIRLLDEWGFFDEPEPRLAYVRWWLRPIESLFRGLHIYQFQLGQAAG